MIMKHTVLILLILGLVFCGCTRESEQTVPSTTQQMPTTFSPETVPEETQPFFSDYQAPLVTFSSPLVTETYGKNGVLTYTCQQMELLLEDPQVSDSVTLELVNHSDFSRTAGPRLLIDAEATGQSMSLTLLHTPARLDRGILSLTSTQVVSGNELRATGSMESATFDLISGKQLSLKEALVPQYDAELLTQAILTALEPLAKEGQLYSDYAYVITELFSSNAPVEQWYLSDLGLCFYFVPYEIAPYNLGFVTAEIPYDALPGLLREEYFPGEALGLVGQLKCTQDMGLLQEQSQFRDLILDDEGEKWILDVDGAVEDLRIVDTESGATLFAAATLCQGDALVIQATEERMASLSATYRSSGETVTVSVFALFLV